MDTFLSLMRQEALEATVGQQGNASCFNLLPKSAKRNHLMVNRLFEKMETARKTFEHRFKPKWFLQIIDPLRDFREVTASVVAKTKLTPAPARPGSDKVIQLHM